MATREFDVDSVKNACEKYLEDRKDWIEKTREKLVTKYLKNQPTKRFFFFKRKPMTREKAIEELKFGGMFGGPWYEIANTGAYWSQKVERILNMVNVQGAQGASMISLDTEEFNLLKDFL